MKTPILVLEYAPLIDLQSYICPGGEIGRHKRLKISRLMGVPVRLRLRAPSMYFK